MERLVSKYQILIKSQAAFERAIDLYKNAPKMENQTLQQALQEAMTVTVIKHFELYYETFVKYLKLYLNVTYGIDVHGSKTIFRAYYDQKMLTEHELKKLFEIVEIRNVTTHVYDEEAAKKISLTILDQIVVMKKLTAQVSPN